MKDSKDSLGSRMKEYEGVTRYKLNRRGYTVIRVDGKGFSKFTANLKKPFDDGLIEDMDATAIYLCSNIQGAKCAYVQSDEITIVVTDFDTLETSAWFDNNLQKMCSISSALATSMFNALRVKRKLVYELGFNNNCGSDEKKDVRLTNDTFDIIVNEPLAKLAQFDARVFQVPTRMEVENNFIWRQQDATRNSIQMVTRSLYSHKEVEFKTTKDMHEMIFQKGQNWNDYPVKQKRGRVILKETYQLENGERSKWVSVEPPIFSQDREFLRNIIPNNV